MSRRCRQQKDFDVSRRCREGVEQTESLGILLDGLSYVSIGIEKTQKNLNRRGFCRTSIETSIKLVSSNTKT